MQSSSRKSAILSAAKKAKLKSNPSRVSYPWGWIYQWYEEDKGVGEHEISLGYGDADEAADNDERRINMKVSNHMMTQWYDMKVRNDMMTWWDDDTMISY